ncbi:DUF2177 family protein [Piscinibacter sakaiensis]|uniref:DUF2177 family protein n=1 Tax=Piscinibacter sakaiensis TaxID=1547922 RepID=UPI003726D4C8
MRPDRPPERRRRPTARRGAWYLGALLVLGLLDALWLGLLSRDFYQREVGHLLAADVNVPPAVIFYLLYPVGVVVLGLATDGAGLRRVVARSAVLGLVAYGAYDLTNLATLQGWSTAMTVVDMAWGTFITAAMGAGAWLASGRRGSAG